MKILSRRSSSRYQHNSGSILIIVIWAVVFFSVLGVSVYSIVSAYAALSRRIEAGVIGPYLASAAYIDTLRQIKGASTSSQAPSAWSDRTTEKELGIGKYICKVRGENGKINISAASSDVLARLTGLDKKAATKITTSPLKPFCVKEEILMVEGVTDGIYNAIKDYITVYGDGKVNINTAPDKVLEALGMGADLINEIRQYQAGPDGKKGTADDGIFTSTADLTSFTKWLSAEEKTAVLNMVSGQSVSVSSDVYLLDIDTEIAGKKGNNYKIVMNAQKILRWTE